MIEFVTLDQAAELDRFVENHPSGHFMQSSYWGKVKKDWAWTGLISRDQTGQIRGTMALLRHDLRYFPSCFFYAPRGPIFSRDDVQTFSELINAAAAFAKEHGAYLLRIDPEISESDAAFAAVVQKQGFRINQASDFSLFQPRLCYVSSLEGKDKQVLEAMYHRSTRCNVHKALRGPVSVRFGSTKDLPAFCRMMAKTGAKNSFKPRSKEYFSQFINGLEPYAKLYIAELDAKPIAASIGVFFGKTCSLCFCCSEYAGDKLHANELLQWYMQTDAIEHGCIRYDFRGVEGQPVESNPFYGLHRYKRGFGAEFCAWIGQLDLPLRPVLYQIVKHSADLRAVL